MLDVETLSRKLHEKYLEATKLIHKDSYNAKAQVAYDNLTEEQKAISIYIAKYILGKFTMKESD